MHTLLCNITVAQDCDPDVLGLHAPVVVYEITQVGNPTLAHTIDDRHRHAHRQSNKQIDTPTWTDSFVFAALDHVFRSAG